MNRRQSNTRIVDGMVRHLDEVWVWRHVGGVVGQSIIHIRDEGVWHRDEAGVWRHEWYDSRRLDEWGCGHQGWFIGTRNDDEGVGHLDENG